MAIIQIMQSIDMDPFLYWLLVVFFVIFFLRIKSGMKTKTKYTRNKTWKNILLLAAILTMVAFILAMYDLGKTLKGAELAGVITGFIIALLICLFSIYVAIKEDKACFRGWESLGIKTTKLTFLTIQYTDQDSNKSMVQNKQNIFIYENEIVLSGYLNIVYKIIDFKTLSHQLIFTCQREDKMQTLIFEANKKRAYLYNESDSRNLYTFT